MPVSRQRQLQIDQRRRQVAELTLKGHAQHEIAARLDVGQATVSEDLKQLRAAWRESGVRDFDSLVAEQLNTLAMIHREAWEAWEHSKQPAHTAMTQGAGEEQKTRHTLKRQHGDPRFLEQVQKCMARACVLLGLDLRRRADGAPSVDAASSSVWANIRRITSQPPPSYSNVVDGEEEYERLMAERIREKRRQKGEVEPELQPDGP